MEPIIQVKGLGKKYNIRHFQGGYIALRDVLMAVIRSPFKFLKKKIKSAAGIGAREDFWALSDVSFDIMPGEIVGIIGKNGAGKSTLLKILTRITPPTTGEVKMNGRVASLLEVGTGFHPELSGRENIFLNGAIIGMTKAEIAKNFDSIVQFAEIEKFLDTPVKFYSSGMYVRLAFSVAAHMEPDILLVDEVLAVGDAEFQKKCLGKMEEVTRKQGRTIIFVSHNMPAIQSLCKKCILLEKGKVKRVGKTEDVINYYLSEGTIHNGLGKVWKENERPGNKIAELVSTRLVDRSGKTVSFTYPGKEIGVEIIYEVKKNGYSPVPSIHIFTNKGEYGFMSYGDHHESLDEIRTHKAVAWIPANILNTDTYTVGVALGTIAPEQTHFFEREAIIFQVIEDVEKTEKYEFNKKSLPGVVKPLLSWNND
jgi:lipopolysaccharide transport system ATP-binding protein